MGVDILCDLRNSKPFLKHLAQWRQEAFLILPGSHIISEGEESEHRMYIIIHGIAQVSQCGVSLGHIGCGDAVREFGLFGVSPTNIRTVVAVEMCVAMAITEEGLVQAFLAFPDLRSQMMPIALKHASILHQAMSRHGGGGSGDEAAVAVDDDWKEVRDACLAASPRELRNLAVDAVYLAAKASPLLHAITLDFIVALSEVASDRIFMPGDTIMQQGAQGDSMFIILSGEAEVFSVNNGLKEKYGTLSSGSITGELAMLRVSR